MAGFFFFRQSEKSMPKTEHWQWYVEHFAPGEEHHHAVERSSVRGRSEFQQIAVVESPFSAKCCSRRRYAEFSARRADLSRDARPSGVCGVGRRARRADPGRRRRRDPARSVARTRRRTCTMVDIDGLVVDLAKRCCRNGRTARSTIRAHASSSATRSRLCATTTARYHTIVSDLTEPLEDSPSNTLFNDDVFRLDQIAPRDGRRLRAAGQHGRGA